MAIGQWFSFQGRIRRKTWWLAYVLPLIGISILATVLDIALGFVSLEDAQPAEGYAVQTSGIGVFGIAALVLSIWGGLAGQVKRWHDRDKSGWFVLVNFIPLVGAIWVLVEVGFLRGTAGPNRFGPDPLGGQGAPQWQPGGPPQGWQPQGPCRGHRRVGSSSPHSRNGSRRRNRAGKRRRSRAGSRPRRGIRRRVRARRATASRLRATASRRQDMVSRRPVTVSPRRAMASRRRRLPARGPVRVRAAVCRRCGATDGPSTLRIGGPGDARPATPGRPARPACPRPRSPHRPAAAGPRGSDRPAAARRPARCRPGRW